MTPIYDELVIEREGHPSDDDIAHALAAWRLGDPLPFSEDCPDGPGGDFDD